MLHRPVLLAEALTALITDPDGVYIDATFGRGGHTRAILERLSPQGVVLAIDKDPEAIQVAQQLQAEGLAIIPQQGSFARLQEWVEVQGFTGRIKGVLFDLGVSSPQLDNAARGFSFMREGPLDMRMDTTIGITAAQWLQEVSEIELARVLEEYGEERYAKRIAHAICSMRRVTPMLTTLQLAECVKAASPHWDPHKHPATRAFQAIRIAVNAEFSDLEKGLEAAVEVLSPGGRLVVISFHSIEDRIVKYFIRANSVKKKVSKYKKVDDNKETSKTRLVALSRAVKPSAAELRTNRRARSAVLRVAQRQ